MSEAQTIRDQARRAKGNIEDVLAFAVRNGAKIDLAETAKLIREYLNEPHKARTKKAIPRSVVAAAAVFARHPRPQELLRTT